MPRLITNPIYPPQSSPFSAIAKTIKPRLASYCGIDPGWVFPVANDRYTVTIAEQFFLYFQFFNIEPFTDTGGGRANPWAYRRMRVYIYTRQGADPYGIDTVALQGVDGDEITGGDGTIQSPVSQFQAEELVAGALFNWMPLNPSDVTVALAQEPWHFAEGGGPPLRKPEDEEGLLRSNLDFSIRYGLNIDVVDPAR